MKANCVNFHLDFNTFYIVSYGMYRVNNYFCIKIDFVTLQRRLHNSCNIIFIKLIKIK